MATGTGPSTAGGHVRWRRRLLIVLVLGLGVVMFTRSVGVHTAEFTAAGLGVAALAGLYLWRGPKLHEHLRKLRPHRRTGSLNYPGQQGKGLRQPLHRRGFGGGGTGIHAGGRRRPALAPFRRAGGAGSRAGSHTRRSHGRVFGLAGARRRSGGPALSGRRNGSRRRLSGGSGASRRGTGGLLGTRRRRPAAFRRSRGLSGGSRPGSRGFGRSRTRSRGAGSRRRSLFRPSSWHRRAAGSGPRARGGAGRRPGTGRRPAAGRRGLFRRLGWRRRPSSRTGGGGGGTGGGQPRVRRRPGRLRRAWWRAAGSPGRRASHGPGPLRYAWWRLTGMPGLAGSRGTRRRVARARRQRQKARLKANPGLNRHRPWYAPWRLLPGGKPARAAWRVRARGRFRLWRWKHGLYVPRNRYGRRLSWRDRIRRRWRIWRGHPGAGAILLGGRPRRRRRIATWFSRRWNGRRWLRRRQQPPKPMPAWTGTAGQRITHARQYRWLRGGTPVQPQPQPRKPPPVTASPAPGGAGTGNGAGPSPGAGRTSGAGMAGTIQQLADEIESHVSWDPDNPQDLHDSIQGMSSVTEAVQKALHGWAERLRQTNVDPEMPEALDEAAGQIGAIIDELDAKLGGGVMDRRGG